MKKFSVLTTLLILTRFADAQTTYLYTPTLAKEANPLVSILGFNWAGLILIQIIGLSFIIYSLWVYCFKSVHLPDFDKELSLTRFISLFHFGNIHSFSKLFYKLPTNKNSLLYSIGYILTYSLISISIIVSFSTILLLLSKKYQHLYSALYIPIFLYLLSIATVIFYSLKFYKTEQRERVHLSDTKARFLA